MLKTNSTLPVVLASLMLMTPFIQAASINCMTSSATLEALVNCLVAYTVPSGYYTVANGKYEAAQPTPAQRTSWSDAITRLLNIDGNCPSPAVEPTGLEGIYSLGLFTESVTGGRSFCVLSEQFTATGSSGVFARGWGFAIVPATAAAATRSIHFSAPHPVYDKTTPLQAAVLFSRTGAKSVVVTGRHRIAYAVSTDCVIPSDPSDTYYKTDPAHDNNEPFHDALLAVEAWQTVQGGCPNDRCAYIQMHRKADSTCSNYDIFLSSGLGNSVTSETWYSNTNRPVRRLKNALDTHLPPASGVTHGLPTALGTCSLTATKNIFGRFVNGRAYPLYCTNDANRADVEGEFVHIEQADAIVGSAYYDQWTLAIQATFPTI